MRVLSLLLLFCPLPVLAQINEHFTDNNFSQNPAWSGDTAYWQVVDGKLQSHLPGQIPDGAFSFHLSTASTSVESTSWEFWVQLHFNPSSANFIDVYLCSQTANPSKDSLNTGYFVRIGNTTDEVSLYRKDQQRKLLLINGQDNLTDHSNNILRIRVTCDRNHQWTLYSDESATGEDYFREGSVFDSTYLKSRYFSLVVYQNGKTASEKHFFDDIIISPFTPDTSAPRVQEVLPVDKHRIDLLFSESLDPISVKNVLHYLADQELNFPDSAKLDDQDLKLIHLYFKKEIISSHHYHLQLKSIADLSGNTTDTSISFIYYQPKSYEVIMDELFPDPTPSQGLPEYEFIELKNNSAYPVNLNGWQICDPTRCAVFPPQMLQPGHFLIVCDHKHESAFASFGKTVGLTHFPTLNNRGDELVLQNKSGAIIHAVAYNKSWYGDEGKDKGGYSLEMQDIRYPCQATGNWTGSHATTGGTPGIKNSVNTIRKNIPLLALKYVGVSGPANLLLHFNLGLDSLRASHPAYYKLPGNKILSAAVNAPLFNTVLLHLSSPLQKGKAYTLYLNHLEGCNHTVAGLEDHLLFGLSEQADSLDLVINEILFNPWPGSHDFIEVYNRSSKIIDVSTLQLATRNGSDEIVSVEPFSSVPYDLFPDKYVVATTDKKDLMKKYFCKNPKAILEEFHMPAYPNERGDVILSDTSGQIIDEVKYTENDHFSLFHQDEGVSLERVSAEGKSNDPVNWHSASSVAGYATPTYLNSQASIVDTLSRAFTLQPEIFSPDGDGIDDQTTITYNLPPGYMSNILIFNETGRPVRHLLSNNLLGTHGKISWNGKDDKFHLLPTGLYILSIELYNLKGAVKNIKMPVVLAKNSH